MTALFRELRFAIRRVARAPLFTGIASFTLAVGIGANSAIFSVVDGILLKPLPYDHPDELVSIGHVAPGLGAAGRHLPLSEAIYFTYRTDNRTLRDIGLLDPGSATITGESAPDRVTSLVVTDGTLTALGVPPLLGRSFGPSDDVVSAPPSVVLSYDYWQHRFGGDRGAVGRNLIVDGVPHQIIGVLPRGVRVLQYDPAVYLPARLDPAKAQTMAFRYEAIGRVRSNVTLRQAEADLARVLPVAFERYPNGMGQDQLRKIGLAPSLRPLREQIVGDVGRVLWVLLGTVGLVLLLACTNVANLFLVQIEKRHREVAVHAALGAAPARIVGGFLAESLVLTLLGAALGLGLAFGAIRLLAAIGPASLPRLTEIRIDGRVLAFTGAVSLLVVTLVGLLPAFRFTRRDLYAALKRSAGAGGSSPRWTRVRSTLVVLQVALALVLLIGSGLMVRSVRSLRDVDPGFHDPDSVGTFRLFFPEAEIPSPDRVAAVERAIVDRIAAVPGVIGVGSSWSLPMTGARMNAPIEVEGVPVDPGRIAPVRRHVFAGPGYVETLRIPVVVGRPFTWPDLASHARVALVSENLAREQWGSPSAAVGKQIRLGGPGSQWSEIVGVVGNVREDGMGQDPPPTIVWPMSADLAIAAAGRSVAIAFRTDGGGPAGRLPEIQRAVWSVEPNIPLAEVRPLRAILDGSMERTAFAMVMLTLAAGAGLALGLVGIYGVISQVVSQRTREIGLRLALGAVPNQVLRIVIGQAAVMIGLGIALGLVAAVGSSRVMAGLLHGVRPFDPATYGAVALIVAAVAFLASVVPARRAAAIEPAVALRFD